MNHPDVAHACNPGTPEADQPELHSWTRVKNSNNTKKQKTKDNSRNTINDSKYTLIL